jgi:hypothetical protein
MLQINFYPESNKKEYIKAAEEYQKIWGKEGAKIVKVIEKYSGLTFKTKVINALTFEGISYSMPMQLRSSYNSSRKKAALIHELIHRLLIDNNFWFKQKNFTEEVHKVIDLILYDIWVDLLGKDGAEDNKKVEISYGNPAYKKAWEWALSFSKEERAKKFKKMRLKYQK